MKKKKKRVALKELTWELIDPTSDIGQPIYALLEELVEAYHEELVEARIALAWNTAWQPDVDGRVTLGRCKKATDLDRELAPYDFVIILQKDFWTAQKVGPIEHKALLDHELMHATVQYDADGQPKVDARGRTKYRIRKHDIEEFGAVVARWGLYKRDLVWFVQQVPSLASTPPQHVDEDDETESAGLRLT